MSPAKCRLKETVAGVVSSHIGWLSLTFTAAYVLSLKSQLKPVKFLSEAKQWYKILDISRYDTARVMMIIHINSQKQYILRE